MTVMDFINYSECRNVSFDEFRKNKFKVNRPNVTKFLEFIPIKFISWEIGVLEYLGIKAILNDSEVMKHVPYKDVKFKKF
jgi:hypothetical protein